MKKIFTILVLLSLIGVNGFSQIPTNGLVGYWPFNGNANDLSGNGNNGIVHGAMLTTDRLGNTNSAYSFDGISNYVEITNTFFNNGWLNYTISGWFSSANVSDSSQDLCSTIPISGVVLGLNKDYAPNRLSFSVNSNPVNPTWDIISITASTTVIQNNQWYFFTFIKNGDNYKFYVNGSLEIDTVGAISPISYLCGMNIGIQYSAIEGYNNGFDGKLDDYRIYNRVLNSTEITSLYNEGNLSTCLVASYPFNGNANDVSGNGNNGTVNGATLTTDRFGNPNSAYLFNGTNDYIQISNTFFDNGWTNYTISGWMNSTNVGGTNGHVLCNTNPVWGVWLGLNHNLAPPNTMTCNVNSYANNPSWDILSVVPSTTVFQNNQWYFYSFVKNGNNYKLYINGNLEVDTVGAISPISYLCGMYLGISLDNGLFVNAFNGKLDDYRFFNCALNQAEITSLYNEGLCYQIITVTDTLIINASITGFHPVTYLNTIKIYPNPTSDHITIDYGNYNSMINYTLMITNSLGQTVFTSPVNQPQSYIDLSSWTGNGLYFVYLKDANSNIVDIKKIILQ